MGGQPVDPLPSQSQGEAAALADGDDEGHFLTPRPPTQHPGKDLTLTKDGLILLACRCDLDGGQASRFWDAASCDKGLDKDARRVAQPAHD